MTVPHRIVCHIKMAISDGTKPDMGWRRAPLASDYAALRQGKKRPGSRYRPGFLDLVLEHPLLLFLDGALCACFVSLLSSQAKTKKKKVTSPRGCRLD